MKETNPKAKLSMCALATALLGTPLTAVSADNVFIKTGEPGWWGEAENWQDQLPPNEDSTAIKFGKNEGLPFAAYLEDGDHFAYPNATVTVNCNGQTKGMYTTVTLSVPTNSSLSAKAIAVGKNGENSTTSTVEVVGGSLTASGSISLLSSTSRVRQADGTVAADFVYLNCYETGAGSGPCYELLGGELNLNSTGEGIRFTSQKASTFCQKGGKVTASNVKFNSTRVDQEVPELYDLSGGEIDLKDTGVMFKTAGLATFRQRGGTLTASQISFNAPGDGCSRYELLGGTLTLTDGIAQQQNNDKTVYPAVFSMRGSTPKMTLSRVGCSVSDVYLLMEFVIDRTGAPSIGFAYNGGTTLRLNGAYVAKLDGGLQLLHTNTFAFVDTHVDAHNPADVKASCATYAYRYADLNTAERHLWTFGPHEDANSNPTGVLAKTQCFGAQLNPNEEFVPGRRYDGGRSCGWVRLPRFKSVPDACRVLLDVVPQDGHTLDEIAEGLTSAGYQTKYAPGTSVLRVTLPSEGLRVGSTNEVVAFDFAEYGTAASVRALAPTDVRALVRQVDVVKSTGLMLLLK